jgi:hypothetical protein
LVQTETIEREGILFHINREVTDGKIKKSISFTHEGTSYAFQELVQAITFKDFEKLFVGATQRTFVRALVTLYNIDGYNHNKMMQKLQYQSTKLRICNESKSYLALLEEIYNFKERGEKLRFF